VRLNAMHGGKNIDDVIEAS